MTATDPTVRPIGDLGAAYVAAAAGDAREHSGAVARFRARFATLQRWQASTVTDRLDASPPARPFAAFTAVHAHRAVGASGWAASRWGRHPEQATRFRLQASSLGFDRLEVTRCGPSRPRYA
jgi:hypothetical protein